MLFQATGSIVGGGTATPFSSWSQRTPKKPGLLEVLVNATAVGMVMSLTTGTEAIVQADIPVAAGGTAGVFPSRLNNEVIADTVESLDEMVLTLRNTTGGAVTYNVTAIYTPRAGK